MRPEHVECKGPGGDPIHRPSILFLSRIAPLPSGCSRYAVISLCVSLCSGEALLTSPSESVWASILPWVSFICEFNLASTDRSLAICYSTSRIAFRRGCLSCVPEHPSGLVLTKIDACERWTWFEGAFSGSQKFTELHTLPNVTRRRFNRRVGCEKFTHGVHTSGDQLDPWPGPGGLSLGSDLMTLD